MKTKTNYETVEQEVLSETEIDKDENIEVPMFIPLPKSAPKESVKSGTVSMILPWCC